MAAQLGGEAFEAYRRRFEAVREDFLAAVASCGLPFAERTDATAQIEPFSAVEALRSRGVTEGNDGKSLWHRWISPACIACRKGLHTESFITSTQCPRQCFFCFNPNQPNYEYYRTHVNPLADDLERRAETGERYDFLAVTGGEPLLHPDATLSFLQKARQLYPEAHTRLYTSGYRMGEPMVRQLAEAGLDEVRFSIKLDEGQEAVKPVLAAIGSCVGVIPAVMVEMPVMPDQVEAMKPLLCALDSLGIVGINLLELGFPFRNAEEFRRRGYLLKPDPYRVIYGYRYSGGLPIQGSGDAALELMDFALDGRLSLGVHYCSVENRLTGQVYRQNAPAATSFPLRTLSERDGFLKSAKVFGDAIGPSLRALEDVGLEDETDRLAGPDGFLEFPLRSAQVLADLLPQVAIGISYAMAEEAEDGYRLVEVKLEPLGFEGDSRHGGI